MADTPDETLVTDDPQRPQEAAEEELRNDHPTISMLEQMVMGHGEAHVTVDGHDEEAHLRKNPTNFDFENEVIFAQGTDTVHVFPFDSVLSFYEPREVFHE